MDPCGAGQYHTFSRLLPAKDCKMATICISFILVQCRTPLIISYCLETPMHLSETLSDSRLQSEALATRSPLPFLISQVSSLSDSLKPLPAYLCPAALYFTGAFPSKSLLSLIPAWHLIFLWVQSDKPTFSCLSSQLFQYLIAGSPH